MPGRCSANSASAAVSSRVIAPLPVQPSTNDDVAPGRGARRGSAARPRRCRGRARSTSCSAAASSPWRALRPAAHQDPDRGAGAGQGDQHGVAARARRATSSVTTPTAQRDPARPSSASASSEQRAGTRRWAGTRPAATRRSARRRSGSPPRAPRPAPRARRRTRSVSSQRDLVGGVGRRRPGRAAAVGVRRATRARTTTRSRQAAQRRAQLEQAAVRPGCRRRVDARATIASKRPGRDVVGVPRAGAVGRVVVRGEARCRWRIGVAGVVDGQRPASGWWWRTVTASAGPRRPRRVGEAERHVHQLLGAEHEHRARAADQPARARAASSATAVSKPVGVGRTEAVPPAVGHARRPATRTTSLTVRPLGRRPGRPVTGAGGQRPRRTSSSGVARACGPRPAQRDHVDRGCRARRPPRRPARAVGVGAQVDQRGDDVGRTRARPRAARGSC